MADDQGPPRAFPAAWTATPAPVVPPPGGVALLAAAVQPATLVLRWAAVGFGLVALAPANPEVGWSDVAWLAICVFLTTLRTILPLRLGATDRAGAAAPLLDVAVFATAVGWTGTTESPWLLCLLVAVGLAAYGWGSRTALLAGAGAVVVVSVTMQLTGVSFADRFDDTGDLLATAGLALAAAAGVFLRARALEAASVVERTGGELVRLSSANALLEQLTEVVLTLPGAFTMREVLERTRTLLRRQIDPRTVVLVTLDEVTGEWTPKITDRATMRASYHREDLPQVLRWALDADRTVALPDDAAGSGTGAPPELLGEDSTSGVYLVLRARDRVTGLLAMEHPDPGHFEELDPVLLEGLADVIALTIDNARWFARLRNLGAEDERLRVARDVHDRLGQWLTYIKMELERLSGSGSPDPAELTRLHDDAAFALDELRETLRQLRSGVTDDRPLSLLGEELVRRFAERTGVDASFEVDDPDQRLPVPVENELLRILQESLNNVDRHARATRVRVRFTVEGGNYELSVDDDGCGFEPAAAMREQAYGVVGMRRRRAEVIGATFTIDSRPGSGTRLSVRAGSVSAGSERAGPRAAPQTATATTRKGSDP
ncbi:MAG: GAF domain-containing sensor histidine kinase [Microthrixaceae bacterium]